METMIVPNGLASNEESGYLHRPVFIGTDAAMPINQALGGPVGKAVNDFSALGWDVILPPMMIPVGGKVIGSGRSIQWVLWVRCPLDRPEPPMPVEFSTTPVAVPVPDGPLPSLLSANGERSSAVH